MVASAVAAAQLGDVDAATFLYVRYADDVYGVLLSSLRDERDARRLTHEVFANLATLLASYDVRQTTFDAWLRHLARKQGLDRRRGLHVPVGEVQGQGSSGPAERRRQHVLHDALAQLPADQRKVLMLRHIEGLSPGEIAALMAKSEATISGLHQRGRLAMKAALREGAAEPATG